MRSLQNKIVLIRIFIIPMLSKSLIILSIVMMLLPALLCGQFEATDETGLVGEKICINISFAADIIEDTIIASDTIAISGEFHLSNPTVFYPELFTIPDDYTLIETIISRFSDSTYSFILSFRIDRIISDSVSFKFCGEALAGSDSLCQISFSGMNLNDKPIRNFESIVKISTIAGTIPYIQFPRITNIYPNPVRAGESLIIQYYIYKKSNVKFYLLNVAMQEKLIANIKSVEPGIHEVVYTTSRQFAAGAYWIVMKTNFGFDVRGVVIIK